MHTFNSSNLYQHPLNDLVLAFYLRYPNPFATHVITADVLTRSLSPSNQLHTLRLLRKRGKAPSIFGKITDSWILEESILDLKSGGLDVTTRNLDHTRYMEAVELLRFRALDQVTACMSEGWVRCNRGMKSFRKAVEGYGIMRLQRGTEKARMGLQSVVDKMKDPTIREKMLSGLETGPMNGRATMTSALANLKILTHLEKKQDEGEVVRKVGETEGRSWINFWRRKESC